jgi:hypothetical protein
MKEGMRRVGNKIAREVIWFGECGKLLFLQAGELSIEAGDRGALGKD